MLYFSDHAMGMFNLWYPWGLLLQVAAIIHFIRRRPDTYWLWIILIVPFGAIIYLMVEAAPDIGLLGGAFRVFPRRRRIRELEAMIRDNPSAGNYEELADLYMQDGNYAKGRDCYNHAISSRTDSPDPFYRRAVCAIELKDFVPAVPDLERVVASKADYDFNRAAGLLAHAYAETGQKEKAEALFKKVTTTSTLSETYLNYASLLASLGRKEEARTWAQKVLDKKPTMPGYLKRRERPWFRKASGMLKRVASS